MTEDSTTPAPPSADRITLATLKALATSDAQLYAVHAQLERISQRTTAKGNPFFEVQLVDGTAALTWRVFDGSPCFIEVRDLTPGSAIELTADWIDTGKYGIDPRNPRLRRLDSTEEAALLSGDPDTAARQAEDWDCIQQLLSTLRDPRLQRLCGLFFERFGDRFRRTAAARHNHHARRGGLVEHVAQMMRSVVALHSVYPHLNRDLLLAGILFHDCGKLWENSYPETGFAQPYNLTGEMLGHIPLGLEVVNKLWRDVLDSETATAWTLLEPPNELVRLHLLHLIASHHGTHEFGSPVLPKTPEAVALHHIDNIDAKLEMMRQGYQTARELAPGIFDRVSPWPTRTVSPLPECETPASEPETPSA